MRQRLEKCSFVEIARRKAYSRIWNEGSCMRMHREVAKVSNAHEEGRCIIFCVSKKLWCGH